MKFIDFLKQAIPKEDEKAVEMEEKEIKELIDRVAQQVVNWRMSIPAIVVLESSKPLSFVASQVLVFFEPIVQSIFTIKDYEKFISLLENREQVELLIQRIEELEDEFQHRGKEDEKEKEQEEDQD